MPLSKKRKRTYWYWLGTAAVGVSLNLALGLAVLFSSDPREPSILGPGITVRSGSGSFSYKSKSKNTSSSIRVIEDDNGTVLGEGNRITFKLVPVPPGDGPLRNATMGEQYRCEGRRESALPPPLREPNVLDFATVVTTDLRTIVIGDSVGQQFSEAMDESAGVLRSWHNMEKGKLVRGLPGDGARRKNLWGLGGYRETLSVSKPLRGGGVHAYWRMTDLWQAANRGKAVPPAEGGGWAYGHAGQLGKFDAVVLNYNSWFKAIDPGRITSEKYEDSIRLAESVYGARAVVIVTYPFTRTVTTPEEWVAVHEANIMLRRLAADSRRTNRTASTQQRPAVLVLEFANFTNQLLWHNARNLGANLSDPNLVSGEVGWEIKDDTTVLMPMMNRFSHTASVCAANASLGASCPKNLISNDDMHWCTETIGARLSAGLSCLLGCVFNSCASSVADDNSNDTTNRDGLQSSIGMCERECNDRFMSVSPVDAGWMNSSIRACRS